MKNLMEISGATVLSRAQQKSITGGGNGCWGCYYADGKRICEWIADCSYTP